MTVTANCRLEAVRSSIAAACPAFEVGARVKDAHSLI